MSCLKIFLLKGKSHSPLPIKVSYKFHSHIGIFALFKAFVYTLSAVVNIDFFFFKKHIFTCAQLLMTNHPIHNDGPTCNNVDESHDRGRPKPMCYM